MTQKWDNLLFAHWPVSVDSLRPFVPEILELDTFDGQAWIGIIAFEMSLIRLKFFPIIPYTVPFPEMNVRTYIQVNKKPGVFFMTLDASNPFIIHAARAWYHLPYYRAKMSMEIKDRHVHFHTDRVGTTESAAMFQGSYRPVSPLFTPKEGTLEHWLTERYMFCCKSRNGQRVYMGDIYHDPWQLQEAEAVIQRNTMTEPFRLPLSKVPVLSHFSPGTQAFIWCCRKII
ncbi:YqjF family protein [Brevibacillus sp. H7]|uniref:YqjF family protein n=1 Tax=Brevibacillus sp. H7 TaxID=3349138 RepID=UPI0037FB4A23